MRKYLLSVFMSIFVCPLAFGDTPDLKSAEQVAKNYLQLQLSGDYNGAASLVDPESIDHARSHIITFRQDALKDGETDLVKLMDISYTDEELEELSPQDFFVKVIMKMQIQARQRAVQRFPQQMKERLDSLKSISNSAKVVHSKMLPDGNAQVDIQIFDPMTHHTQDMPHVLKLYGSEWKIVQNSF